MNFIELKPGKSVEGHKILSYKTEGSAQRYIYLLAGVHGDEVEGVYCLEQYFNWLKECDDLNIPMVVIPMLNVDGHSLQCRTNAHGVDLNRNLKTTTWSADYTEKKYNPGPEPLSEPENKYLVKLFSKFPPKLIISFHSWKPMINYNGDCLELAKYMNSFTQYEVASDVGYPTPGSLGDFGPNQLKAPVITYELPQIDQTGPSGETYTLKEIWQENQKCFEELAFSPYFSV
jgi:murein peptide amidase A